ncbi:MAG: carboxyvinyl-carboxyphosphonate phosphorylmutase [Firmicutes bacterium]|nr:carboxyvinyl-carboxyphosphonate phosphorylmutase [Bacillota bacterium]
MAARATTRLRQLLDSDTILMAPGAYDGLTAALAVKAGFQALYMTGAGVSYTTLGKPDIGLLTQTEMAARVAYMVQAADGVPVIADGDTGYGNALNVIRTIAEFERAGAAAIQLEDQTFPKRCGHMSGKELIPAGEAAAKIAAAAEARRDPDFVIIARTDALAVAGWAEALHRAHLYTEAGADVIFIEAPHSVDELAVIPPSQRLPCMANMVEGGATPLLGADELGAMGFKLVIYPNAITRAIARTARELYAGMHTARSTQPFLDRMLLFGELNELLGLPAIEEQERRYAARERSS